MSDLVTLTINGQKVAVPKGTNLIEAAKLVGVEIPHFCYHPGLKVVAVCRQCLVEVKGWPKPAPGCQTTAQEGMEVLTQSALAKEAQRQQLEFTLLNHPVDCPICDQVGECELQRLYFDYDHQPARHDLPRLPQRKAVPIGPRVTADEERCILCWRCIRVCDEVAGVHDLDLLDRGFRTVIATGPGRALDNPYSVCTADQCPVGALTETAFRFNTRAYRLSAVDSICPGCATGCHIELHTYGGQVRRTRPRYAADLNRWWMCDDGRGIFREYAGEDRLVHAQVEGREASLADGLRAAGRRLADTPAEDTILFVSAQLPTETLIAARRLVDLRPGLHVFATSLPDWTGDTILRSADRNPNTAGLKAIFGDILGTDADLEQRLMTGTVKLALCLDGKTTHPDLASVVGQVIVLAQRSLGIVPRAAVALPVAAWCEQDGTFLNKDGKVGRFHVAAAAPGQAQPGWALLAGIARAADLVLPLPETAREIYESASEALGEAVLPKAAFGPARPGTLLRFAHRRG